jgi:AcrR family transcriptional regulator
MVGRPSNRNERFEQVMQALMRCVSSHGLEGVSLAQIAKESGMTRPLVRHHLGNRGEIIDALKDYVFKQFADQTKELVEAVYGPDASRSMIEILFSDVSISSPELVMVFAALTARSVEDEKLRSECREVVLSVELAVAKIMRTDHPNKAQDALDIAAHGIVALYFNASSLAPLELPDIWRDRAKQAAHILLGTLKEAR